MLNQCIGFLQSGFYYPGLTISKAVVAILIAFVFGGLWFAAFRTPVLWKRWSWTVIIIGAFLTWTAIAFVQIPLQTWFGQAISHFFDNATIYRFLLLFGLPSVIISGLVQEGAKLVPVILYPREGKRLDLRAGIGLGALSGLAFGVFEAVWVFNSVMLTGFNWTVATTGGIMPLLPFWERFFTIGFHIAAGAIAGWGFARGWGWKFWLVAAGCHAAINFSAILVRAGTLNTSGVEIYLAVVAVLTIAVALHLRYRKSPVAIVEPVPVAEPPVAPVEPAP
jgi:hypothetical protein